MSEQAKSTPIHFVASDGESHVPKAMSAAGTQWAESTGFAAKEGEICLIPSLDGSIEAVLFGIGKQSNPNRSPLLAGLLPVRLPEGRYHYVIEDVLAEDDQALFLAVLAWHLGAYRFDRYKENTKPMPELDWPEGVDREDVLRQAKGSNLARDLINIPANDMGPDELEAVTKGLVDTHGAILTVIKGEALLEHNFPMIHAVGRASPRAPRLLDFVWGDESAPKVTLVGKGVCFDTGGLDLKPSSSMLLMKKDMGGAANVLGLASMIMSAQLPVRLRVLIPAVENAVSGNAFRPGDVLQSHKGLTVEIGNTDAEGRLVLADAMALADEEEPELMIDMATLTGAARVALGPDLPPFYSDDADLVASLSAESRSQWDPLWNMPLWPGYDGNLSSDIADVNHISTGGFAGSITAALFLRRFVDKSRSWVHFDIYGWAPAAQPARPKGGEAQAIRAIYSHLKAKYAK
ncbi:leucyl aminopeptidase family protein [Cohaesibacter sp. CAU 1516]|uniref:leucyl aminopeptidase family protein n=1 Tax=Cohaesibacter sp. CAU 1516 TaxID=2576038 RepID=UPI0010FCEF00|nr:leucyl aminopeptidase family protein [Cohaesibacter sp. CAU 1516]TLP45992.1 leucyl aminopeptidase family protein [Cohaesibacter sp. CAU 1516]